MKSQLKLLGICLGVILVVGCGKNQEIVDTPVVEKPEITQNEQSTPKGNMLKDDAFMALFPELTLPLEISGEKEPESKAISQDFSDKFLGGKVVDQLPNFAASAVGKISFDDGQTGLLIRQLDLPVGSGDHVHYMLHVLDKDGKELDVKEIASFLGWDGGYVDQPCTINSDKTMTATMTEEDNDQNAMVFRKTVHNYSMEKLPGGVIETDVDIIEDITRPLYDFAPFDVKVLSNGGLNAVIKKGISGQFAYGIQWTDNAGDNYLVFTTKEMDSKEMESSDDMDYFLYGYHFTYKDKNAKFPEPTWKTTDFVKNCPFDSMLDLIEASVNITDYDGDNIAETTYAYTLGCASDVSPYDMKLIMHEGKHKMALRGSVRLQLPEEAGDWGMDSPKDPVYKVDEKTFEGQPEEFLKHAKAVWNAFETVEL